MDAEIFKDERRWATGMVTRNTSGMVLGIRSISREGRKTPLVAETMGMKEALSWIKERHWAQMVMETDCIAVVNAIRGECQMLSLFGLLIVECRDLLLDSNNVNIEFV